MCNISTIKVTVSLMLAELWSVGVSPPEFPELPPLSFEIKSMEE